MLRQNIGLVTVGLIIGFLIGALAFRQPQSPALKENPSLAPSSFLIYMAGHVQRQCALPIDTDRSVTVTQAIIQDGGLDNFGDPKGIKLLRKKADGTSSIIPVDFKLALSGKTPDPVVEPDDLINVPQRAENF